jgi:hypothetical protein
MVDEGMSAELDGLGVARAGDHVPAAIVAVPAGLAA